MKSKNQRNSTSKIPLQPGASEQHDSIHLIVMLRVNGEVREIVEEDVSPSSGVMTVINNTVTTAQLKELQEMNEETSIEFVTIVTSTGTS